MTLRQLEIRLRLFKIPKGCPLVATKGASLRDFEEAGGIFELPKGHPFGIFDAVGTG
jgi:hypothetical protein